MPNVCCIEDAIEAEETVAFVYFAKRTNKKKKKKQQTNKQTNKQIKTNPPMIYNDSSHDITFTRLYFSHRTSLFIMLPQNITDYIF